MVHGVSFTRLLQKPIIKLSLTPAVFGGEYGGLQRIFGGDRRAVLHEVRPYNGGGRRIDNGRGRRIDNGRGCAMIVERTVETI